MLIFYTCVCDHYSLSQWKRRLTEQDHGIVILIIVIACSELKLLEVYITSSLSHPLKHGVVFSLSGFKNPFRGDLREKAVQMGALYEPDWGPKCTHLV